MKCAQKGEKERHLGAFEILLSKFIGLLDGQTISTIIILLRDISNSMKHLTLSNKEIPVS